MRLAVAVAIVATQTVSSFQEARPAAPSHEPTPLQSASTNGIAALGAWVDAVRRHRPGAHDEAAAALASMPPEALDALAPYVVLLADLVSTRAPASAGRNTGRPSSSVRDRLAGESRRRLTAAERREVLALADTTAASIDADRFLLRGATLHADTALLFQPELDVAGRKAPALRFRSLQPRAVSWMSDGASNSSRVAVDGLHWQVARWLLTFATRQPSTVDSLRTWYYGTTAWLARSQNLPELDAHVGEATRRLPDDAPTLLLGGWLQEMLASSVVQNEVQSRLAAAGAATRMRVAVAPACSYDPCSGRLRPLGVGSAAEHLSWAETLLSRALERDAGSGEARVRLGRVLAQRTRHVEAIDHLQRALAGSLERTLTFDALLFLGASQEALGRDEAAEDAYRRALALFPSAQSARIALGHLQSRRGAGADTLDLLRQAPAIEPRADPLGDDPWWTYHMGPGRTADEALARLWARISEDPAR